ncbi:MAG TPA: hypothetical protein VFB96_02210 [Pirellulaceae bacterium]|nr:hypothetical protein [Pirellulaceae bacterium]
MGLTFGDSSETSKNQGRLRRVPDYTSRPVKLRLFALVAALMLVLFVAEKARDPRSWRWFFAFDAEPPPQRIENRVPPRLSPTAGEPVGTVVIARDPGQEEPSTASGAETNVDKAGSNQVTRPAFDPVAKAWSQGLKELWNQLSSDQRTLLYRLLESVQDEKLWPESDRAAAAGLVAALDQKWTEYHVAAYQSVAELKGQEQQQWTDVLRQVNDRWKDEVHSPLVEAAAGRTILPDDYKHLSGFLESLSELNLGRVRDDSPFLRPDENQLWHHLFWQLGRTDEKSLAAKSQGQVAYAQLYRQPARYRGQIVTVRGSVRRAYRVQASRNHLGIDEYYVFWMHPFESADTPLVVYALELPSGFPALKERDRDGMTALHEEVAFHGYLFKRGAYPGQSGTYNAPLLLARVGQWKPERLGMRETERLGSRIIWQAVALALAVATVIAAAVYWTSFRRRAPKALTDELAVSASLRSLQGANVLPSPAEALRNIEQQARAAEGQAPGA